MPAEAGATRPAAFLERVIARASQALESRRQAEEDSDQKRHCRREGQHGYVNANVGDPRKGRRAKRHDGTQNQRRKHQPDKSA